MKKMIALIIIFLFILPSCNQDLRDPNDVKISDTVETESDTLEIGAETIIYNVQEAGVQSDSIEKLISNVRDLKNKKISDTAIELPDDFELIVPDFSADGYVLRVATIEKYHIFFYYVPLGSKDIEHYNADYDRDIIVAVRHEDVNKEDPLGPLVDQYATFLNEDGFLHLEERRKIVFQYGKIWVSVNYPESFKDYEDIKQLCKAKTINID